MSTFTLRTSVLDAAGKSVAVKESRLEAHAASAEESLMVGSPHLWDGVADPYLYTVQVEVIMDGKVSDRVAEPLGQRYFNFDKDAGFSLNVRACRLRGVSGTRITAAAVGQPARQTRTKTWPSCAK